MSENAKYIDEVMADSPLLLSCNQTADLLNISRASVYRLMDTGDLDRVRINLSTDGRPTTRITNQSIRNLLQTWSSQTK